jgi:hypothetical protein
MVDGGLETGHGVREPRHDLSRLDAGWIIVPGQQEAPRVERLLDRSFLLPFREAVISCDLRLALEHDVVRLDEGVLDVVDDVAADARCPLDRLDEDVHRAVGVPAGNLADDPGQDLIGAGQLQVEQP